MGKNGAFELKMEGFGVNLCFFGERNGGLRSNWGGFGVEMGFLRGGNGGRRPKCGGFCRSFGDPQLKLGNLSAEFPNSPLKSVIFGLEMVRF